MKGSCIAIVAAFGMVNGPAWADGSKEASLEATTHSLAATGLTNAQVLSDEEMGSVAGRLSKPVARISGETTGRQRGDSSGRTK